MLKQTFPGSRLSVCVLKAAEWVEPARERGEGIDMRGQPEVEMVEAFSEHERHLEAALAAARAPNSTPEARKDAAPYLAFTGRMRRWGCLTYLCKVFAYWHHWARSYRGGTTAPWRGNDVCMLPSSVNVIRILGCIAGGSATQGNAAHVMQPGAMKSVGLLTGCGARGGAAAGAGRAVCTDAAGPAAGHPQRACARHAAAPGCRRARAARLGSAAAPRLGRPPGLARLRGAMRRRK